jgi:hypothetical protein
MMIAHNLDIGTGARIAAKRVCDETGKEPGRDEVPSDANIKQSVCAPVKLQSRAKNLHGLRVNLDGLAGVRTAQTGQITFVLMERHARVNMGNAFKARFDDAVPSGRHDDLDERAKHRSHTAHEVRRLPHLAMRQNQRISRQNAPHALSHVPR